MSRTTATASTATPVSMQQGKASRRIAAGIAILILLGGAIATRVQFANGKTKPDPLRGDSDESTSALADKMNALPQSEQITTLKSYVTDASSSLRYAAIDRLGEQHVAPRVADILENAYTDSSSIVRQRAMETLPEADQKRGLHLLLAGLRDEDTWMREAAITQLKVRSMSRDSIVDQRVLPSLIAALDDTDAFIPFTSINILQRLTGNKWTYHAVDPAEKKAIVQTRWKNWWNKEGSRITTTLPPEFTTPVMAIKPTRIDPAPPFQLTDLDGHSVSLDGQKGRVTLLNFWGTWCGPCQKEIPDLERVHRDYQSRGVDVIGIAVGEKDGAAGLRKWCAEHKVDYRQTFAVEKVQQDYGNVFEVPISVLIDGEGHVRRRWEGERDYDTFRAAIEDVLHPDASKQKK